MSELEFWKDLGNIFDAVLSYQKKNVEFNSRFINPWIRLGNIFERQDQANDAIQAYQHAIEIDPDTAQNWVDLGDAHFKKGGFGEATEAYRKAVILDPEAGWPLGNLALSMVTQGNIEEAIPLYKKSIDLLTEVKDKAVCWNRLGNAYRKLNDYENAFQAFQKADQLDGDNTGFSDKLDETPSSMPLVASEEILEQIIMVVNPDLEENKADSTASVSVEEKSQPELEVTLVPATQMETAVEVIVAASDVEMVVEEIVAEEEVVFPLNEVGVEKSQNESTVHVVDEPQDISEKKFDLIQVVEDVIAKVEQAYAGQENSISNEGQQTEEISITSIIVEETAQESKLTAVEANEEVMSEVESLTVLKEVALEVELHTVSEEVVAESESPIINEEATMVVEVSGIEIPEEFQSENAAPVAVKDGSEEVQVDKEVTRRAPAWLVIKDPATSEEKVAITETEAQQEFVQVESITTLSDISQEVAISESVVNMDIVETYTNPIEAQLTTESCLSDELIHGETAAQADCNVERQSVAEVQEISAVAEIIPVTELAVSEESSKVVVEEQAAELAYEEYLKDVAEPVNPLTDHVKELQGESPLTKISKNGDVRLAMDTKNANVWNELGNIYLNAGTCDDAIAAYSKAIELDRRFAWPYSNLALAYVQKGRFTEAILLYQRGIELFSSDRDKAITWNRLGNVYRRINDYKHAIESYQTADELDPENATLSLRSSFGLLGNMYSDSKPALVE